MNALERPAPGPDLEVVDRFPAGERGEKAGQPEDVVEVTVGDQNAVETAEPDSGAEDLPLSSLAAVDQETLVTVAHHLGGEAAVDGWGGG
ncbi:MAG: hypothetical protein A2Z66_06185 [Chloroflexi bacterium RBG_13_66_10]|nr:MAG: hypothetical protein A2Z66_06185 [Chloroflexi bacterium RBG_13_66_10]